MGCRGAWRRPGAVPAAVSDAGFRKSLFFFFPLSPLQAGASGCARCREPRHGGRGKSRLVSGAGLARGLEGGGCAGGVGSVLGVLGQCWVIVLGRALPRFSVFFLRLPCSCAGQENEKCHFTQR